ncbi:MAG: hypothetical protein D6761_11170 [Candidatus Dadabacteria bacterium]|nr:MAG: hypothetical protein D6761_11170 [Candidatus Dadabacteria bacterium]
MPLSARKSFGIPESWWYGLRVTVYFLSAACGVVWLAWALRMPVGPRVVRVAQDLTPEALMPQATALDGRFVRLPGSAPGDLQMVETGDPVEPWTLCTLTDPLNAVNTIAFVGSRDRLPGCRILVDTDLPQQGLPVTDRTTDKPAGYLTPSLPKLAGLRLLVLGTPVTAPGATRVARVVRLSPLQQAMPQLQLPRIEPQVVTDILLAVLSAQPPAAPPPTAEHRIVITNTGNRAWLILADGRESPEPGPIYARVRMIDADKFPLADRLFSQEAGPALLLTYIPVTADLVRLPKVRRYNLFLAISLILLGLLGLIHHIQSSSRAEVEDIVLFAAQDDEPLYGDDDQPELPRVPADKVPPERSMNLVPRSRTLKDWVFATDADRRAFIRLCVVKWTGGADPEHLSQFQAFMTAAVAELLRDLGADASGDTPSRQQAWMLWAPLLKNAAGVAVAGTTPEEGPVLAAARYTTVQSPAFAAMLNARPLRWFVRVGAETMGITRQNKP